MSPETTEHPLCVCAHLSDSVTTPSTPHFFFGRLMSMTAPYRCSTPCPLRGETTKQLLCILACVWVLQCFGALVNTCSLLFPMTTCSILPNATWEEAIGDNRAVIVLVRSSQCFSDYSMMSMTVPHRWHTPWKQSTPCACARADLTPHMCVTILTTCLRQCFNLQRRKDHFLISFVQDLFVNFLEISPIRKLKCV